MLVRVRRDVKMTSAKDARTGSVQYFAKNMTSGEVFYFGEQELFLCEALDGTRSLEAILAEFSAKFGTALSEPQLSAFIRELSQAGLLEPAGPPSAAETSARAPQPAVPASPAAETEENPLRVKFSWRLFDPSALLSVVAKLFWPVKHLVWMLLPATLLAGLVLIHHQEELVSDIVAMATARTTQAVVVVIMLLLAFEFCVRTAEGAVATAFGARVTEFGILLAGAVIPRMYVDTRSTWHFPRRARLWICAAPLLMRLTIFAVATFIWISFRSTGTALPQVALTLSQIGFWAFVINAIPLLPGDGFRWISEYVGQPLLIDRAVRLLDMKVRGRPTPEALTRREKWVLLLFAVSVIVATSLFAISVLLYIGVRLEARFHGAGTAMFLVVLALSLSWFYSCWLVITGLRAAGKAGIANNPANIVAMRGAPAARGLPAEAPSRLPSGESNAPLHFVAAPRKQPLNIKRHVARACILGVLAIVCFLPYPYEAGGDFSILPSARVEVRARVDGEVLNVFVREGDWVENGQVMAVVSDWDEVRDLAVTKASLEKAQADLQHLMEGPKPEEIELAQKQVDAAKARITFAKAEADRQSKLLGSGTASKRDAEAAISAYLTNLADLAVASANLALVKSGTTETVLAAAQAEVRRLEEQYRYLQDQVARTRLQAPVSGRVVTADLNLKLGTYLQVGGLFAELEDSRVAQAEILVPETDISEVQLGSRVRLKPWGYSDREIIGKVVAIAPVAEKMNYGLVVRVKTEVPNDGGILKSEMTGYAKIEGSEMPVWEAFTRIFVRFFRVEVWSWIP